MPSEPLRGALAYTDGNGNANSNSNADRYTRRNSIYSNSATAPNSSGASAVSLELYAAFLGNSRSNSRVPEKRFAAKF